MDEQDALSLSLDLDLDMGDLDFDLEDFTWDDEDEDRPPEDTRTTRILLPKLDMEILTQTVHYMHAEDFAEHVDLTPGSRTFAWVSGSFIFGDLPEALFKKRHVGIKEIYIATLSVSEENIDSWAWLLGLGMVQRFDLLLSGYFYSHEKYTVIPMIYERMDQGDDVFQVAYGPYHCKLMCIRTAQDHLITIHGSANTRSSKNVEHVMIEVDNRELYDFNQKQIHDIVTRYGTVNHAAKPQSRTEIREYFERMRAKK